MDAQDTGRPDSVGKQKQKQFLETAVFLELTLEGLGLFQADAPDPGHPFRLEPHDFKGFVPEGFDQLSRCRGTDPLDGARRKVFFDPLAAMGYRP